MLLFIDSFFFFQAHHAVLGSMNLDAVPNPERIVGPQANRSARQSQAKPLGKFPCKMQSCMFQHFNLYFAADRHMEKEHAADLAEKKISKYDKPPRQRT